jgi:RNA polymerase sigma factor for flagellar operon FliA
VETATRAYNRVAVKAQRDELIVNHLSLVRHVLGRLSAELPSGVDVENLEAAGALGLVEAANSFNAEQGVKFATFARHRVRGAMLDELRRNSPIPQHLFAGLALVRKAYRAMPPPVTVDKLAAATGLSDDKVADCLAAIRLTRVLSLDRREEDAADWPDERQGRPDAAMDDAEQRQLLVEALEALPEQARLVVTLSYLEDLRLKEIGAVLRLSESRVCRLLSQALFDLGEYLRSRQA